MNDVGCIVAIRPRFLCTMPFCHITDEKDTPERSSWLARPLARLMIKSSYDSNRRPGIAWTSDNKFLAEPFLPAAFHQCKLYTTTCPSTERRKEGFSKVK